MRNKRIFLGLIEIAGYLKNLDQGFKSINLSSEIITIRPHEFYPTEQKNYFSKLTHYLYKKYENKTNRYIKKLFFIFWKLSFFPLFIYSIFKFDTFIYFGGNTFFNYKELFLLKLLKKQIIYVFLGSDARPPYINAVLYHKYNNNYNDILNFSFQKKQNIMTIEKYADDIVCHHTISQFFTKKYIDFDYIGNPRDFYYDESLVSSRDKKTTKILHAPSRANVKGTSYFSTLISKLIDKGYAIEYHVLENVTNQEVINKIQESDIILDEIYADLPLGGIAIEGAMFKKAVLIAGYNDYYINNDIFCYSHPGNIEALLIKLIDDIEYYDKMRINAYNYFKKNYSKKIIASKYLDIIQNNIPLTHYKEPTNDSYIYGYGLSNIELKVIYIKIINKYGIENLLISKNKLLEKKILNFIEEGTL